ncbi:MAG: outer membrane beta-barrel protein [Bacteroidia bacterium]
MQKLLVLIGFGLLLSPMVLHAQTNAQLRGQVLAAQGQKKINSASVMLISLADSSRDGRLSDQAGNFIFRNKAVGDYLLRIEMSGYDVLEQNVTLIAGKNDLGALLIENKTFGIDEVKIEAERSMAEQKGDTTEYNATAFTTNPDANAQDLIEKMPGVVVQNGQVQAQGEQVTQVLVDGKQFFGSDPNAALQNLPAEVIQSIQVYDQQSEQSQQTGFDDGNTTKTINIVTKVESRNGTFGSVYAGYGDQNRYQAGGSVNLFKQDLRISVLGLSNNINKQNFSAEDLVGVSSGSGRRGGRGGGRGGGSFGGGGNASQFTVNEDGGISTTHAFGINYSDDWGEKVEVSSSYFFNYSDNSTDQFLRQQFLSREGGTGQIYEEDQLANTVNLNHRFSMRLKYDLSEKSSFTFRPSISAQQNMGADSTYGQTSLNSSILNLSDNIFSADLGGYQLSGDLYFRQRFAKRGRSISVGIRPQYQVQDGTNQLQSSLSYFTVPASQNVLDQQSTLDTKAFTFSTNTRYTEPLGLRAQLQLSYEYAPQFQDSDKRTFNYNELAGNYIDLDTALSNTFDNTYEAHEVGAGLMYRTSKWFLMSRINYQYAQLENLNTFPTNGETKYNFNSILPFVMLRYRVSKQKQLRIFYRTSTSPPSISQLQNVVDNTNPLQLSTGNPDLIQDYTHRVMLRYNLTKTENNSVVFAYINGQYTQNYIANSNFIARRDTILPNGVLLTPGTQLSMPVNLDHYWNLRSFITYGKMIEKLKTNMNLSLSAGYVRQPSLINGALNNAQTANVGLNVVFSSNISENVDFTISSQTNANQVVNTLQPQLDSDYISQQTRVRLNLIFGPQIVFRSTLNHQLYRGLSDEFNQDYWLWTASVAKKFLKNNRGELALTTFDVLGQNTSINRTVNEFSIQDLQTTVLQRYFMLTFTYRIRQFEGQAAPSSQPADLNRPPGGGDFRRP